MTAADDFRAAIRASGLEPPDVIEPGKFHKFPGEGKRNGNKAAWCKLFPDGLGGIYGDYSTGLSTDWHAKRETPYTPAEREAFKRHVAEARAQAEAERKAKQAEARNTAANTWKAATPVGDHAYLKAKGVKAHGVRFHDGKLVIPMRDAAGELHSLQFIGPDSDKKFLTGGRVTGCYFSIGKPDGVLCIAEGFATGASIHEATGYAAAIAFNAGNLEAVAKALRQKLPEARLILCADDDAKTPGNPGLSKATEAARTVRGLLAVPDFGADRPDGATDFNDLHRECGAEVVKAAIEAAIGAEVAANFPRVWLDDVETSLTNDEYLKGLIGRGSHVLIYGPAGDGKTFFSLDLLAHVACDIEYRGRRVRQCLVVYVAAEAGASILRRFFAWRERHLSDNRQGRMPLAIVTQGANLLNVAEVEALLSDLRAIAAEAGLPLGIVAFDTFSRSTPGGDENAAVDVTRAIAAADQIRDELGATSVFVHHSGKDVARGARGHSSLFAAADTVISVIERVATIEKARDGIAGEQFAFDLEVVNLGADQDGDAVTTCVVIPCDAPAKATRAHRLTDYERIALDALKEEMAATGETRGGSSVIPAGVRSVHVKAWGARFYARMGEAREVGPGAKRQAFFRTKGTLIGKKLVGAWEDLAWLG